VNLAAADPRQSFAAMSDICARYNECVRRYAQQHPGGHAKWKPSTALLQHLMAMVYNRSITDPNKLNRYKGWSAEVVSLQSSEH